MEDPFTGKALLSNSRADETLRCTVTIDGENHLTFSTLVTGTDFLSTGKLTSSGQGYIGQFWRTHCQQNV
jgi:hypothetical protein